MQLCKDCGYDLMPGWNFCPRCGLATSISTKPQSDKTVDKEPTLADLEHLNSDSEDFEVEALLNSILAPDKDKKSGKPTKPITSSDDDIPEDDDLLESLDAERERRQLNRRSHRRDSYDRINDDGWLYDDDEDDELLDDDYDDFDDYADDDDDRY